jgi:hypothetical protein
VHTIPFGQLGQITNFSRDWITVKFNLCFARDTDIEKLRKAAKKIGADMMEMPAIKADILTPFKMQGVADIADNALLVRFKFTAKPGNPAAIQREAVKRMFSVFPAMGIEFAKERRGCRRARRACLGGTDGDGAGRLLLTPMPANAVADELNSFSVLSRLRGRIQEGAGHSSSVGQFQIMISSLTDRPCSSPPP